MIRNADKNLKSPDNTQVTEAKSNKINFAIMSGLVEINMYHFRKHFRTLEFINLKSTKSNICIYWCSRVLFYLIEQKEEN